MSGQGKRAGSRRAARPPRRIRPGLLLVAVGVTLAVVAWGYLVWAAVDFGTTARGGDERAWWFLALASVGAIACLFIGLMLIARLTRALGITTPPPPRRPADPSPVADDAATQVDDTAGDTAGPSADPRPPGGRRAAR